MRYKCASCELEFNHQTLACPACHSEEIYQSLEDSSPDLLDGTLKHDVQKTYCHPSTDLGNFDFHYSAARRTITVTVKIHSQYDEMYFKHLSETERSTHLSTSDKLLNLIKKDTGTASSSHRVGVIREFNAAAIQAVSLNWNNRFEIAHKRFDSPAIKLEFKLEASDLATSHYEVEIRDANVHVNNMATVREVGRVEDTRYHRAVFTSDVSGSSGASYKREEIVKNLVNGYKIPFPNYSASSFGASVASSSTAHHVVDHTKTASEHAERAGKQLLRDFAGEFRRVIAGTDYKLFKINIEIKAPINRTGSLLEYIFSELGPQEIAIARRNIKNLFVPIGSEERYVKISIASADPACTTHLDHINRILRDTAAASPPKSCPDQNTISHEFGHMLGLPDEYACISRSSEKNIRHLGMNVFRSDHSFASWTSLQLPENAKDLDPVASKNQEMFLILCDKAQLPPPLFGHSTTSLMSAGSVLQKHHAVTILEAFCDCMDDTTQMDDWEIRIL